MSLVVFLDRVINLTGRGDRLAKITFRGLAQFTKVTEIYDQSGTINFNERLEWPVASNIQNSEVLDIQIFGVSKLFANKLVGSFRMVLQQVVQDGRIEVCEMLLDQNNTALNSRIFLRLDYQAPDGTVGNWQMEQFGQNSNRGPIIPANQVPNQVNTNNIPGQQAMQQNQRPGPPQHSSSNNLQIQQNNQNFHNQGPINSMMGSRSNLTEISHISSGNNRNRIQSNNQGQYMDSTPGSLPPSGKPDKRNRKKAPRSRGDQSPAMSQRGGSKQPQQNQTNNSEPYQDLNLPSGMSNEDQKNLLRRELIDLIRDPNLNKEEPTVKIEQKKEPREPLGPNENGEYELDPLDPNIDALSLANSDVAVITNVTNKRSKPEIDFEPFMQKCTHFQIQVSIIEAKQLSGTNMDPVCAVQIGEDKKYTSQKQQTNSPYWNEVFVFEYNQSKDIVFDKIVKFEVFTSKNLLRTGALVGMFKMDIGTIYEQPDHQFSKKWAVLTDPNDLNTGPKGYLKVDISVAGKGDVVKSLSSKADDQEDDIESNMLVPAGLNGERQRARFMFKIYHATGLPKMTTDITGKIKATLLGDTKDRCDSFVEITFCGQKGKTSIKNGNYAPSWNEQIVFTELFPPMCCRVKLQLKDNAYLKDYRSSAIGTHYIDLSQICNPGDKGFLPTFGPTYVNLYGAPRSYSMLNEYADLNEGMGEGVAFRGQVMVAVDVQLVNDSSDNNGSVEPEVEIINPLSEQGAGNIEEFFLFSSILEASMLDKKVADKNVQFELSMGNYGNFIDGQNISLKEGEEEGMGSDDENGSMVDGGQTAKAGGLGLMAGVGSTLGLSSARRGSLAPDKQPLVGGSTIRSRRASSNQSLNTQAMAEAANKNQQFSTTPVARARSQDKQYYHMPFLEMKPCMHLTCNWHDHKRRLYNGNIMEKILQKFSEGINDVEEMIKRDCSNEDVTPERRLRGAIDEFRQGCEGYIRLVRTSNSDRSRVGKNKLDKERSKLLLREMETMVQRSRMLRRSLKAETLKDRLSRCIEMRQKLDKILSDPQDTLPDIFIWMLINKRRIAYARLPARRVIYSIVEEECGKDCAKIQTLFLTLPGHRGLEDRTIQAKLEIYMWFGLTKHRRNYMGGLPIGYNLPTHMSTAMTSNFGANNKSNNDGLDSQPPPPFITYREKQEFILRAHLFQARGLAAADDSGLSDPFAKVIFSSEVATTFTLKETLNPNWDQTLVLGPISMYGRPEEFKQDPPLVIIEIFDYDQGGGSEFVGRTVAIPKVKMSDEVYETPDFPAELDWYQIYCGRLRCGELLACFELIQCPYEEQELDENLWTKWCNQNELPMVKQNAIAPKALDTKITIDNQEVIRIPRGIRPILVKHRVEILFWGLRELKRIQMIPIQAPRVDIEIAGRTISSSVIMNFRKCPNFMDNIKFLEDIELPDNWYWCPPISIKVVDCRTFGREQLIGTHICHNLSKFKYPQQVEPYDSAKRDAKKQIQPKFSTSQPGQQAPPGGDTGGPATNVVSNPFDTQSNVGGPGGPSVPIDATTTIGNNDEEDSDDEGPDTPQLDWWSKYFASDLPDLGDDAMSMAPQAMVASKPVKGQNVQAQAKTEKKKKIVHGGGSLLTNGLRFIILFC